MSELVPPAGVADDGHGGWYLPDGARISRMLLPRSADPHYEGPPCNAAHSIGYVCTRPEHHSEHTHEARVMDGRVIAVWSDVGQLVLEPVQCRCPHGEDWHAAGGCEARGCACEVEPR